MQLPQIGDLLIIGGLLVVVIWVGWWLAGYCYRRYIITRTKINEHGVGYVANRRNILKTAGVFISAGIFLRYGPDIDTEQLPNASQFSADNLSLPNVESRLKDGIRRFELGAGGYNAAEWTDDGKLRIIFFDDPPMHEWYFVGPKPERRVIEAGTPPNFGGSRTVSLPYPIQSGEYMLTGAKIDINEDNILASDTDRTGTARFEVKPDVAVTAIEAVGDGSGRAAITIKNVGSCPYYLTGAKFSNAVPGTGTMDYEFFQSGKQLLLPRDERQFTTESRPFSGSKGGVSVPDAYQVSIWAHNEPWAFEVTGDSIEPLDSVPSSLES